MPNPVAVVADNNPVRPWQGIAPVRLIAASVACIAAMLVPSIARADESAWPTAQAKAYNFDFVPYLDPPEKPAAICLVDSGVDITPDTPADSPDGPILERTSLDGGPGTGVDSDHGTYMAMTAGAPMNGWGTVGLWPGLRIVSVRAMPQGQTTFPFDDYRRAIEECDKNSARFDIVAVNLSLECACAATSDAQARLDDTVAVAHQRYGVSVLASAGNDGSTIRPPANGLGVFSVAAMTTADRSFCAFSNRGPDLDLAGPGCGLDGADPHTGSPFTDWAGGTSSASATISAALALLRSYSPTLTWVEAEQLAKTSAMHGTGALDVAELFRAAALGSLVDIARAREDGLQSPSEGPSTTPAQDGSSPTTPPPGLSVGSPGTPRLRTARPRFSLTRIGRALRVSVTNRAHGLRLSVRLEQRLGEFQYKTVRRISRGANSIALILPRHWHAGRLRLAFARRSTEVSLPAYHAVDA